MKKNYLVTLMLLVSILTMAQTQDSKGQHTMLQQSANQAPRVNNHPLAQWWPNAGFGLFVHFGMSAVDGGFDLSWGMIGNKSWEDGEIAPVDYWKLIDFTYENNELRLAIPGKLRTRQVDVVKVYIEK